MANLGPNAPYATPWKRYQTPLTRLKLGEGILTENMSSGFAHPSGSMAMDIYVNDNVFWKLGRRISSKYRFTMTDGGLTNDFIGASNGHWIQNRYWIDGTHGMTTGSRKIKLGDASDDVQNAAKACINVATPQTSTAYFMKRDVENRLGNKVELVTIEPGLHLGLNTTDSRIYADDDYYEFDLDYEYLNKLPKQYHGAWSCWMYIPASAGDYTYSQDLPSELNLRPFSVHINPVRFGPKQDFSDIAVIAKDFGITTYLISKPKGEAWLGTHEVSTPFPSSPVSNQTVKLVSLDVDYSIGDSTDFHATMHHAVSHGGAERQQDLRLEMTFPDTTVTPATMYGGQYLQVVIVPH